MTRRTRPGSIQSALQEAYRAAGGVEAVAADLGLSLSSVSYGTEQREDRPGGLGLNHVDRLARMHPEVAAVLARHFAGLAGGMFAEIAVRGAQLSTLQHARALVREAAEGSAALMALVDGEAAPDEVRQELMDIEEAAFAARQALERGA